MYIILYALCIMHYALYNNIYTIILYIVKSHDARKGF